MDLDFLNIIIFIASLPSQTEPDFGFSLFEKTGLSRKKRGKYFRLFDFLHGKMQLSELEICDAPLIWELGSLLFCTRLSDNQIGLVRGTFPAILPNRERDNFFVSNAHGFPLQKERS